MVRRCSAGAGRQCPGRRKGPAGARLFGLCGVRRAGQARTDKALGGGYSGSWEVLISESANAAGTPGNSDAPAWKTNRAADTAQHDWQAQPQSGALVVTSEVTWEVPGIADSAEFGMLASSAHAAAMARPLGFTSGSKPQQPRHQTVSRPVRPTKVRAGRPSERGTRVSYRRWGPRASAARDRGASAGCAPTVHGERLDNQPRRLLSYQREH